MMNPNPDPKDCQNPRVYFKKRFRCENCNTRFKEKWMLVRHVESSVCLRQRKVRGPGKMREDVTMRPYSRIQTQLDRHAKPPTDRPTVPAPLESDIDIRLPENFKIYISGPARSGKTTLVYQLLQSLGDISRTAISKTVWVYRQWQDIYVQMQSENLVDEFIECSDTTEANLKARVEEYMAEQIPFLLILDDCMHASPKTQEWIAKLFTTDARHRQVSVIYIRQKFFGQREFVREIDRNADVIVLTENKRETGRICQQLAGQMGGMPKAGVLNEICLDATRRRVNGYSGYLWINLSNDIDSRWQYMTNVVEDQGHIVLTYEIMPGGGFKKMILMSKIRYNDLKAAAERDKSAAAVEEESDQTNMDWTPESGMLKTLPSKRRREEDEENEENEEKLDDPDAGQAPSPTRARLDVDVDAPLPRTTTPPLPTTATTTTPPTKRTRDEDDSSNSVSTPKRVAFQSPTTPVSNKRARDDDDADPGTSSALSPPPPPAQRPRLVAGISPISRPKQGKKAKNVPAQPVRARSTRQASLQANKNFTEFKTCQDCGETFKTAKQFERHVSQSHYY